MPGIDFEAKQNKEFKYKKILNNLLDIRGRDQAIFTKVNGSTSFDVTTKFSENISQKILSQKEFKISLNEKDIESLIEVIKNEEDFEKIINEFKIRKEKLFNTKKLLLENPKTFKDTRGELVEKLEEKVQKSHNRWKSFIRRAIDENIQENTWPLHVGSYFISVKTNNKEIYAPLLLREVILRFENNKLKIISNGDWKINEKVIFILNQSNFGFDDEITFHEQNFIESAHKLEQEFGLKYNDKTFSSMFIAKVKNEIINKQIENHEGVVMGLFKPSGGNLRKTMMKIIENDEIDKIINPEVNKNIYRQRVEKVITSQSNIYLKIQNSNYSQDKSAISSLIQDTIIWGPPGTGKSQTISNIIANILFNNSTAVVMSQKKAALDVLKKRLGSLAKYAFFILNDKKMNKAEFYKPLQKFVAKVENAMYRRRSSTSKIITQKEIRAINSLRSAKISNRYKPSLEAINHLMKYTDEHKIPTICDFVSRVDKELFYPDMEDKKVGNYIERVALSNGAVKRGFIIKMYPRHIRKSSKVIYRLYAFAKIKEINNFISAFKKTTISTIKSLLNISNELNNVHEFESDQKYLDNLLSKKRLDTIESWNIDREGKKKAYKRFANAVRAGRRLPFKFVNDHGEIIRELFPILITTPQTSFINWKRNSFDYAIVDESSQVFLEVGLPILYLAKIKILAGDPKQMKPSRWFSTRDDVDSDEEMAENAESLLDYGIDKGMHSIMLDKNYRSSYASLMAFSSKQFYNSRLSVADVANAKDQDPIEVINVNGKWENSVNTKEAEKAIQVLLENINKYETIILLTFNLKQKMYIMEIIIEKYPQLFIAIDEERLSLRNIENIQGDEAELIIASVVYDNTTNIASTYVARKGGKNALNVAISRAKQKMIVIKSVTSENIKSAKSEDFIVFKRWLEFLDMPQEEQKNYSIDKIDKDKEINVTYGETDSGFEDAVISEIQQNILTVKQIDLIKQYEVGSKKIDIAFVDAHTKKYILGLEVDGYKYHEGAGVDKYLQDLDRQRFLEAKGYDIFRVKEINWAISKTKVINQIDAILTKKIKIN